MAILRLVQIREYYTKFNSHIKKKIDASKSASLKEVALSRINSIVEFASTKLFERSLITLEHV